MPSLPGQYVSLNDDEWGLMCYVHHDRPATKRICTESDSFGSEYHNMCDECNEEHIADKAAIDADPERWETCKCGNREPRMIQYRDMDEGMHGPVYEHCSVCHEKWNQRIAEEEAFFDQDDDDDWYDDRYDCDEPPEPTPRDASTELLEKLSEVLTDSNIKGFKVDENGLTITGLEPRKFKRLKRKLLKWFSRYTDAYTRPQEGVIGTSISDSLGFHHGELYAQFSSTTIDRYSLADKPSVFILRCLDRREALKKIHYGPFIQPVHTLTFTVTIYE